MLHRYADVHRALQMPERDTLVDATAYLNQLCFSVSRSKLAGSNGQIRVELSVRDAHVKCTVTDNGAAPTNGQPTRGLTIVDALARSLDGRFAQQFGAQGSTATLVFPLAVHVGGRREREPGSLREQMSAAENIGQN